MGRSPVTLSRLRLGRLKVVRRRLLQRYEHQPLVSCLAGLYGCQWRRYQRSRVPPGGSCCSKLECASLGILIVTFALTLVLLYLWSEAQNDYNDFDWFNFVNLGFWFPWSMVLLVIAAVLFTYVSMLLVLAVCLLSEGQRLYLHWGHKIGILVTLTFSIVATAVLSDLWSGEWRTLLLSFQVTAPYLHVGGVLMMTALSWPVALHFFCISIKMWRAAVLGLFLALLLALYLVPLGMYSPCIKDEGTLGPAPALIGHRGAPMLAPENTEMSFEKAVEAGAQGLETDVTLSYDGVPFLMHDRTLQRTTNVQEVFPNRTKEPAAMFSWSELEQLNAGAWFLSRDPFGSASSLNKADQARSRNQSVYTLRGFLDLAARHDRLVIFDLYRPPIGHPYRDTWITRTLEVVQNESSIRSSQACFYALPSSVMWLAPEMRYLVQELDPELQQTSGQMAPIEELQEEGISITTNAPQILINLSFPLFIMTPEQYRLMWVLTDIVSAVLVILTFSFHWWRERGLAFCASSRPTQDNRLYSKFR
ncbi:glycerophosphodiester phosphodiesterase domain-containing protein 4-like, partial [Scleropages formosus]